MHDQEYTCAKRKDIANGVGRWTTPKYEDLNLSGFSVDGSLIGLAPIRARGFRPVGAGSFGARDGATGNR
jgi:hypothetical protein